MSYEGPERRKDPLNHEVFERLRQELDFQEQRIAQRLDVLEKNQNTIQTNQRVIERKIDRWETGGTVLRWAVIAVMGAVTALVSVFEWAKQHLH